MLRPAVVAIALSGACLASGCSSMKHGAIDAGRATKHGLGAAVAAPFKDFGLMKAKVPPVLKAASEDPYKLPASADCESLTQEIAGLDLALGPDIDMPPNTAKASLVGRGSRAASDAALDAVKDLTTGWIPFRGTVRRLTGASENEDEIEDAVLAGSLRRAYLKGLGLQMGCGHPTSPMPSLKSGSVIAAGEPAKATAPAPDGAQMLRTGERGPGAVQAAPISSTTAALAPGG